jgi:TRAP-type C4-dicarboxylate transport system permease small subunit
MTTSVGRRLGSRLRTVGALIVYFTRRERVFLAPLLLVLLLASLLLLATGGLGYVAPFVYSLF